jgi:hypothetical protein
MHVGACDTSSLLGHRMCYMYFSALIMGSVYAGGGGCLSGGCPPVTGCVKPVYHNTHIHCNLHSKTTHPNQNDNH